MTSFIYIVTELKKEPGFRWDLWSSYENQTIKLVLNECGTEEKVIIDYCDIETFRAKLKEIYDSQKD